MARTVLVADDSPVIQNKAKGILTGEGFDVVTVSNGVAAIKKLSQLSPLIILADVSMPGKDGYEVCDFVKNSPDLRHVPVLLVVSDMEDYNEQRAAQVHADGFISKRATKTPFNPEELIATVSKFVARCEASAPKPGSPELLKATSTIAAVPEFDIEEPPSTRRRAFDLGSLSGDIAFTEPTSEAIPAEVPSQGTVSSEPPTKEPPETAEPKEAPTSPEPVLIEESGAGPTIAQATPPTARPGPEAFHAPAEITEPVLTDDWDSAVSPEPPVSAPRAGSSPASSAISPKSFSPNERRAGPVQLTSSRVEPSRTEPPVKQSPEDLTERFVDAPNEVVEFEGPATEFSEGLPEPAAEATPPAAAPPLDLKLVYKIVNKVVAKTSPAAIPLYAISEMVNNLVAEIMAELNAEYSQDRQGPGESNRG